MKRLSYILPLLFCACGQVIDHGQQEASIAGGDTLIPLAIHSPDTTNSSEDPTGLDSLGNLEVFKSFALNYSPTRKPNVGVAKLPALPDSVLSAMTLMKNTQPKEFEKYLTLIFIKLYSAHLECCQQSYEVRKQPAIGLDSHKDPIVYEFNSLAKMYSARDRVDFISSDIGYDYVKSHKHLLDFEPIKQHVGIIEQIHNNIENGVYWE
jgi:hypothetical protein